MKTNAERSQKLRDIRKAAGLVLIRIWATKAQAKRIKAFAESLMKPKD